MNGYTTAEAAELVGVSKNTLLRWLSEGRLTDVPRDWRNWRVWSEADLARAAAVRDALHGLETPAPSKRAADVYAQDLSRLGQARGFRAADRDEEGGFKVADWDGYGEDLSRLDAGRAYRAG